MKSREEKKPRKRSHEDIQETKRSILKDKAEQWCQMLPDHQINTKIRTENSMSNLKHTIFGDFDKSNSIIMV